MGEEIKREKIGYELIAADMDGTLLDNDKRLREAVISAVKRVSAAGVRFCLCSGRPAVGVKRYHEQLGLDTPAIICNGAKIVDLVSGATLYERGLETENACRIFRLGCELGTTVCVWSGDSLYSNDSPPIHEYKTTSGVEPIIVGDIEELCRTQGVTKIVWYDKPKNIPQLEKTARERLGSAVNIALSAACIIEFFSVEVSKAAALERLCGILGCDIDKSAAIGDSENDLPMLLRAGTGVAMGNASDGIKAQCDMVTLSNEEDGVAYALERLVPAM